MSNSPALKQSTDTKTSCFTKLNTEHKWVTFSKGSRFQNTPEEMLFISVERTNVSVNIFIIEHCQCSKTLKRVIDLP